MGILDGMMTAPQVTPSVMAGLPMLNAAAPQMAQQPQQGQYQGLKKPPPPVGTTINGYTYMGGDPRSQDPSVWAPANGDEFLNSLSLDDDKKTLIKMMANYEAPASGARGIGSPEVQQLVGLAKRYDPKFDIKNYKVRQDYLHDLNDQKANGTIQALSNAAMHAKSFDDEFQKLGNTDGSPDWWNRAKTGIAGLPLIGGLAGGSDRLKAAGSVNETSTVLAPEIARVAQGGAPTVDEVNRQIENLSYGQRPSTEAGVMSSMAQKIGDRMLSMQAQYRRAFGDQAPKEPLMTPEAAQAAHQLLKRYAPDYEGKLDYRILTAGGFSPQKAQAMANPKPSQANNGWTVVKR